ncbi:amidase [Geodermatophilus sp. SYSU D01176]
MDGGPDGDPGAPVGAGRRLTGDRRTWRPGAELAPDVASARALDQTLNAVITWIDEPTAPAQPGPLAGLRIGLKDNIDTAGVRTTCGSDFFRHRIPSQDAEVVTRLRAAGARITAKLNMAEFAVGVTSQNSAFGGCRNPWDPDRAPGGSSGGSGAAVAAGLVDAALGTDTGGSVRLPAAMCGVTGLRPSAGRISTAGVFPVSSVTDTVGPVARSVAEVERLFTVLADPQCPTPRAVTGRVGVPRHFFTEDVDPGVAEVLTAAARDLATLGTELVDVRLPGVETAQDVVYTLVYSELAEIHRARVQAEPGRFHPDTLARIRLGLSLTPADRDAALRAQADFRATLDEVFTDVDAVLTPTLPVDVPLLQGGDVIGVSRRLGQFTYPWSLHAGPTLALPAGSHPRSGMPVGAQLTAATGREEVLFALGRAYQDRTGWHRRWPPWSVEGLPRGPGWGG